MSYYTIRNRSTYIEVRIFLFFFLFRFFYSRTVPYLQSQHRVTSLSQQIRQIPEPLMSNRNPVRTGTDVMDTIEMVPKWPWAPCCGRPLVLGEAVLLVPYGHGENQPPMVSFVSCYGLSLHGHVLRWSKNGVSLGLPGRWTGPPYNVPRCANSVKWLIA